MKQNQSRIKSLQEYGKYFYNKWKHIFIAWFNYWVIKLIILNYAAGIRLRIHGGDLIGLKMVQSVFPHS